MAPLPLPTDSSSLQNIKKATSHLPVWAAVALVTLFVCFAHAGQTQQARAAEASAPRAFPYVAYVVEPDTYVRSGPGGAHYPTGTVPAGYAVEVFRHDGSGWCAIRPPEGSYSWVDAQHVRALGDGTAEILGNQVVARVGSSLSPQRSAVQVMLERGERIKLVPGVVSPDGRSVAIAAPAGEFRWIAAERLSLQPPMESGGVQQQMQLPAPSPQSEWQSQHAARQKRLIDRTGNTQEIQTPTDPKPEARPTDDGPADAFAHLQSFATPTQTDLAAAGETNSGIKTQGHDEPIQVVPGSPADAQLAQYQAGAAEPNESTAASVPTPSPAEAIQPIPANEPAVVRSTPEARSPDSHSADSNSPPRVRFEGLTANRLARPSTLEQLQLDLSRIVVKEPKLWQFESLKSEVELLIGQTDSIRMRTEAEKLLDQIGRFEQIRNGRLQLGDPLPPGTLAKRTDGKHDQAGSDPFDAESPSQDGKLANHEETPRERALADLGRSKTSKEGDAAQLASIEDAPNEVRYDAVGKLKPVVSHREGAPRYALVDEQGNVVSFVTSTPDLNLQPYIGRRIGINGTRGFMPEYRRAHVTASRVTPVRDTKLR